VAKLFPPRPSTGGKPNASDPGHGPSSASSRVVRCEASRSLKWTIANTGVVTPVYRLALPSPDSADLPLFQISKPNLNATHWSMFYFAYAGHLIPPKRIEFGKIQKNPAQSGGGTRISITGKTAEEKAVWQTLGEGNEDCVEWVVLCAALNLLESVPCSWTALTSPILTVIPSDEILKAAERNGPPRGPGA
jgi:neural Wiskott-Aldrich syndrome protein